MKNNESLEKRLRQLENAKNDYRHITNMLFNNADSITEEQRLFFIAENNEDIEKLKIISHEIREIRWKLMTPQQQNDYLKKHS